MVSGFTCPSLGLPSQNTCHTYPHNHTQAPTPHTCSQQPTWENCFTCLAPLTGLPPLHTHFGMYFALFPIQRDSCYSVSVPTTFSLTPSSPLPACCVAFPWLGTLILNICSLSLPFCDFGGAYSYRRTPWFILSMHGLVTITNRFQMDPFSLPLPHTLHFFWARQCTQTACLSPASCALAAPALPAF